MLEIELKINIDIFTELNETWIKLSNKIMTNVQQIG